VSQWLNRLLVEVWPYYDRGVCSMVKDIVEPIMEMYRPPGIMKRIFFQELTFGEAPFRVEGEGVCAGGGGVVRVCVWGGGGWGGGG
jgi:Ca2+-dependent lipid-binding protein